MQGPGGETFDRWMELANGCVCCEVRDELPFALERLMEATNTLDGRYVRPCAAGAWLCIVRLATCGLQGNHPDISPHLRR